MRAKFYRVLLDTIGVVSLACPAASAFDFADIHSLATGQTSVLSLSSPGRAVNTPGFGMAAAGTNFEIGYTRKYDLADLDRLHAAFSARKGAFSFAAGMSQLGKASLYTERVARGTVTYERGKYAAGLTGSALQTEFGNNYGRFSAVTVGAGLGVRMANVLASVSADNLTRPKLYRGAVPFNPAGVINLELLTQKKLSLMVRVVMIEHTRPRIGFGQRIPLARVSALYWGVSTRPLEYGGGIDISARGFVFTYAASIHPVLGLSQGISLSWGSKLTRTEPPATEEGNF